MRYALLLLLTAPTVLMALLNIFTQYKMKRISKPRFVQQFMLWILISTLLLASFPVYNLVNDKPLLYSKGLSLLDILQTTAIVYLVYIINNFRRKIEQNERTIRDLHQEISINLSSRNGKS
jgi:hypothetical protein